MWTTSAGTPFLVIGENIHATRIVLRTGRHMEVGPEGGEALRFVDLGGSSRLLPVPDAIRARQDFATGRVKLVAAAIVAAMSEGPDCEAGLAFLHALAYRQQVAGADYLDLNVDEVAADAPARIAAMRWAVSTIEPVVTIPFALDSSSSDVIAAGLEASARDHAQLLLNSASVERLDVLDLAARTGCAVVVSASGRATMPASAAERIEDGRAIIEAALERGIGLDRLHVDCLVLPVAVEPESGVAYLDAIRGLRARYGPRIHFTGGLSNVSFGLPARRLLNDVFLVLATDAGADSGIVDPLATDPSRAFKADREARAWRLAAAFLTGADEYGAEYLAAFRAGELAAVSG